MGFNKMFMIYAASKHVRFSWRKYVRIYVATLHKEDFLSLPVSPAVFLLLSIYSQMIVL